MHIFFKILLISGVSLLFAARLFRLVVRYKQRNTCQRKARPIHRIDDFDPKKDFDFNFLGLTFIFIIFFMFFSFSIFWVLSIDGVNLIGFWAFIIGFITLFCSYFYVHRKGMLDL